MEYKKYTFKTIGQKEEFQRMINKVKCYSDNDFMLDLWIPKGALISKVVNNAV